VKNLTNGSGRYDAYSRMVPPNDRALPLDPGHALSTLGINTCSKKKFLSTKISKTILGPDTRHHVQISISSVSHHFNIT
jgi:hypothetical protein